MALRLIVVPVYGRQLEQQRGELPVGEPQQE